MVRVLIPLPDRDFDVTEVSVPWKLLREAGREVTFATAAGVRPAADPLLITGVVFGKLGASREPLAFYRELGQDPAFQSPASWSSIEPEVFDGLILPGGHAPGMRQYVEDEVRAALASPDDFVRGPTTRTVRGTREDDGPAFVVEDGSYLSARWPGDAYLFAKRFIARLEEISGNPR